MLAFRYSLAPVHILLAVVCLSTSACSKNKLACDNNNVLNIVADQINSRGSWDILLTTEQYNAIGNKYPLLKKVVDLQTIQINDSTLPTIEGHDNAVYTAYFDFFGDPVPGETGPYDSLINFCKENSINCSDVLSTDSQSYSNDVLLEKSQFAQELHHLLDNVSVAFDNILTENLDPNTDEMTCDAIAHVSSNTPGTNAATLRYQYVAQLDSAGQWHVSSQYVSSQDGSGP